MDATNVGGTRLPEQRTRTPHSRLIRSHTTSRLILLAAMMLVPLASRGAIADDEIDALAIVDDVKNRVMLFDRQTGDYIRDLVIPDAEQAQAPFDCELGPVIQNGQVRHEKTILVSDIRANKILAYDYGSRGKFIKVFINNIAARGIAYDRDGKLLIAAGEAGVRKYEPDGSFIEVLAHDLVDGPSNAWDVLVRPVGREWWRGRDWEILVADVNLDALLRFDMQGNPLGVFAKRKGFRHVEQLAWRGNGNVLAADPFANGVFEFDIDGDFIRKIQVRRPRGVIELGNGNLLISSQRGVLEYDGLEGTLISTKMEGYPVTAPRFIRDLSKKLPSIR
ncbi:MAG: hypothetical protein IID33_18160 [Planctomycetes bacterium]|nr:hypothetical protein [Planctomycetota bacterium]